jgi:RNA polymerase sigma factor (sigma-70 family)
MEVDARRQVVRELVTEYQKAKDQGHKDEARAISERILKRVDKMIITSILKILKYRIHLRKVDIQDLYQTGIVGFYKAINTAKDEDGNKITARIVAYIKSEINSTYPHRREKKIPYERRYVGKFFEVIDDSAYNSVEAGCILEKLADFVSSGELDKIDVSIFLYRFMFGKSYVEIADLLKLKYGYVNIHAKKVQEQLKEYFNMGDV